MKESQAKERTNESAKPSADPASPPQAEAGAVTFADFKLSPQVSRAVVEMGFETPSPIQAQTLPLLLGNSTDFIGLAATGTGKTAAFSIPLLERIDASKKSVQALVLCPTRELALQVAGQIDLLGKYKQVRALPVYGGSSYADQIRGLRMGVQIVVGTPGRVVDHIERGTLQLEELSVLILDEADEMISMGFKEDLERILSGIPRESANTWLFSATMSRDVRKVADQYLREPKSVQVNRSEMLSSTVEQLYYMTRESDKPEVLCKLIDAAHDFYGLIFCQTKSMVSDLSGYLSEHGYKVDCLHGDKDQNARERTMRAFRERAVNMLVCTDVASRGLDVKDITHVVNYSIPRELDSYVHRIGRTARSGKTGIAMSLVTPSHMRLIGQIERMTRSRILEGKIPTRREIGSKKITEFLPRFQSQKNYQRALDLLGDPWMEALATMPVEEVAARFITLMLPDVFSDGDRTPKPAHLQQAVGSRAPHPPTHQPAYPARREPVVHRTPMQRATPTPHRPEPAPRTVGQEPPRVAPAPRPAFRPSGGGGAPILRTAPFGAPKAHSPVAAAEDSSGVAAKPKNRSERRAPLRPAGSRPPAAQAAGGAYPPKKRPAPRPSKFDS